MMPLRWKPHEDQAAEGVPKAAQEGAEIDREVIPPGPECLPHAVTDSSN
jgi:hypothetical protein